MELYPIKTKVQINLNHACDGIITAINIRAGYIQYEIAYFLNGEYKAIWLQDFEFTVVNGEKQRIGFK